MMMTRQFFGTNFRYIALVVTILAAIVTPTPNPRAMLKFMAPMVGLYLVAVLLRAIRK